MVINDEVKNVECCMKTRHKRVYLIISGDMFIVEMNT